MLQRNILSVVQQVARVNSCRNSLENATSILGSECAHRHMSAVAAAAWCVCDMKRDDLWLLIIVRSISEREQETNCKLELFVHSMRVFSSTTKILRQCLEP